MRRMTWRAIPGCPCVQMLVEYLRLAQQLPSLGSDAVHRIAELLKVFNTRTCQLVLGAGAMQVSGRGLHWSTFSST
jgi:vacuolar protein sorting-associated protein 54